MAISKGLQSLETIKQIIEKHIRQYGIKCPLCGYIGKIHIDKKDGRPYSISLQLEDIQNKIIDKRFHYDHIIPKSRGGLDKPENIQLLCPHCNKSKGNKIKKN